MGSPVTMVRIPFWAPAHETVYNIGSPTSYLQLETEHEVEGERSPVNTSGAFTMEQAARLAGLSRRQLAYWDRTNVFSPSLARGDAHQPYGRIYSFQDVVALRTLASLRERFSLEKLRNLGVWLKDQYEHPWSSIRFYVAGDEIVYEDPNSRTLVSTRPVQQGAFWIELEPIAREASESLRRNLHRREPADIGVISRHRYTLRNEWAVAGTRIPVSVIQELHDSGYSVADIVREFPVLTPEDVKAALAFDLSPAQQLAG